jgi:hypothetical protein
MPVGLASVVCTLVTGKQQFAREDPHIGIDRESVVVAC